MGEISIWRLQTNTKEAREAGKCSDDVAAYCINNNVAALGWGLTQTSRFELNGLTFEKYVQLAEKEKDFNLDNVERLHDMKENDLIWMRKNGKYYLARITRKSHWQYDNGDDEKKLGTCNQRTDVKWIEIGDESDVPGALTTAFIRGQTLRRINMPGILEYSKLIYNKKAEDDYRYNSTIEFKLDEKNFYSLISPSDCEDLLYVYSYKESNYSYVCIPSTNKIATQTYEFVAIDRITGKHIYYQVKKGSADLDAEDYYKLIENSKSDEVYLLTTGGKVTNINNIDEENRERIHVVEPKTLFDFCYDDENKNIIPPKIGCWIEFADGYNSKKKNS